MDTEYMVYKLTSWLQAASVHLGYAIARTRKECGGGLRVARFGDAL